MSAHAERYTIRCDNCGREGVTLTNQPLAVAVIFARAGWKVRPGVTLCVTCATKPKGMPAVFIPQAPSLERIAA